MSPVGTETIQIATDADLKQYLWQTFGARIPDKRVCAHHQAPFEAFRAAFFATHPVIVIKASRGLGGKSYMFALLATAKAAVLNADACILGGSGGQSQRVLKAMTDFWAAPNAPLHLLDSEPGKHKTVFKKGCEIEALTASQRSVRGPHPQQLICDEVDEMDIKIFDAAMGQTLAKDGIPAQTTIGSTHQNPNGTMTEVLKRAGERGWPVFSWCYRETIQPHGWLLPSEVERKRGEMTKVMFETEVELSEPSSEDLAIDRDAVNAMFDASAEIDAKDGQLYIFEDYDAGGKYALGGDWARRTHFSVQAILRYDKLPAKLVAFRRSRRRPWPQLIGFYDEMAEMYHVKHACHDSTGIGDVVSDYLKTTAEGVQMVGLERARLFSDYILGIESHQLAAPKVTQAYDAHKWLKRADLIGEGHPPDEFVAMAMAYRAAKLVPKKRYTSATWGRGRTK